MAAPAYRAHSFAPGVPVTLGADQGDETARGDGTSRVELRLAAFVNTVSMSAVGSVDRDDQPPARGELGDEARRRRRRGGVDGDRVERRPLGRAGGAVADATSTLSTPSSASRSAGSLGERRNRSTLRTSLAEPGEDGGRVARSGADLEHPLGPVERQRLADRGDDPWLGDRLSVARRQRAVVIGARTQPRGDEGLARDLAHRLEHALVGDPAPAQLAFDHPRCGEVAGSLPPNRPRSAAPRVSRARPR